MKLKYVNILVTTFLVFSALNLSAGAPPPSPGTGSDTSGPIDSGAVVLLIAVAAYGYLKLKDKGQLAEE